MLPAPMILRRPALAVFALLAACDAPADDDELVARDTLAALGSTSAQLRLYDGLFGLVDLKGISNALAPQQVITQVRAGLGDDLEDPTCLAITTDTSTWLALTFTACRYRGVLVDGDLRIDLTTESGSCDDKPCVLATTYTTHLTDLTIGQSTIRAATSTLRIPTAKSEPRSYTAEAELTDADDRALHLRHELSWTRAVGCVLADLGAAFTIDDREVSVGARGIKICGATCPRAGDVQIAWDSGKSLAWSYTGKPELTITGPRGRSFSIHQSCSSPP